MASPNLSLSDAICLCPKPSVSSACALEVPDVPVGSVTWSVPMFRRSPDLIGSSLGILFTGKRGKCSPFWEREGMKVIRVPALTLQDLFKKSPHLSLK